MYNDCEGVMVSTISPRAKKIPIHERSVSIGSMVVVNGYQVNQASLKQRFTEGGYRVQETPHFLLFKRETPPETILVHCFAPEDLNADIKHFVVLELKPLGLLPQSQSFGEILAGIVASFFPQDVRRAWKYFGANTLHHFLVFLSTVSTPPYPDYTSIGSFVTQYKRICELCEGHSFLDAGCESGFLPLLIAERMPFMERVVGIDIRPDFFAIVQELAEERHLANVSFVQADLLADDFDTFGTFDTVTAIEVIEHFAESDMYRVLANLLKVTERRLIVIVPYEDDPERVYGHKQIFSRASLQTIGEWCLQQLHGAGKLWIEDCVGGLLLIERS